jgi:hypothetical protein
MSILERLYDSKLNASKRDPRPELKQIRSSSSTASRKHHPSMSGVRKEPRKHRRSISKEQVAPPTLQSDNLFLGLGQGPGHSEEYDQQLHSNPEAYIYQLDMDLPEEIDENILSPAPLYQGAQKLPVVTHDGQSKDQDGTLILIGDLEDRAYHCRHSGCGLGFQDVDDLQSHFETTHFTYSRIHPPDRVVCSECQYLDNLIDDLQCRQCGDASQFEYCIYGQFMSTHSYRRYPSDGQDLQQYTPTTTSHYAASYGSPSVNVFEDSSVHNENVQQGRYANGYDVQLGTFFDNSGYRPPNSAALAYFDKSSTFGDEHFSTETGLSSIAAPVWSPMSDSGGYGASPR